MGTAEPSLVTSGHHDLLQAFATRSRFSDRPLMAVSAHYVMGNWAAQPFLGTLDFERALTLTHRREGPWTAVDVFEAPEPGLLLELDSVKDARSAEPGSDEGHLLQHVLPGTSKVIGNARLSAVRVLHGSGHALISGEPGTGKSSLAEWLLTRAGLPFVAVDVAAHADWRERLVFALRDRHHVALRHVSSTREQNLPDLIQMLLGAARRGLRIVMTATPCLPLPLQPLARHLQHRLWIPPLRDRIEDIPEIIAAWPLRRRVRRLDGETLRWLWSRQWPGNVRELLDAMRTRTRNGRSGAAGAPGPSGASRRVPLAQDLQKRALRETLARCEGNRSRAALMLGVSRATLYRKMDQFDLSS